MNTKEKNFFIFEENKEVKVVEFDKKQIQQKKQGLIPVGYYCVEDTVVCQETYMFTKHIGIMIPYSNSKKRISLEYPIILKIFEKETMLLKSIVYTSLDNLKEVIKEELTGVNTVSFKIKRKVFVDTNTLKSETISFLFQNYFEGSKYPDPWIFAMELLEKYSLPEGEGISQSRRLEKAFYLATKGGNIFTTCKIGGKLFATKVLKRNFLLEEKEILQQKGWNFYHSNIAYYMQYWNDKVKIISWKEVDFQDIIKKSFSDEAKAEEFLASWEENPMVLGISSQTKFLVQEILIEKNIFFLFKEEYIIQLQEAIEAEYKKYLCRIERQRKLFNLNIKKEP